MTSKGTQVMIEEHTLLLRMVSLVEQNTALLESGKFRNWQFYLDAAELMRQYADSFHQAREEDILFAALASKGMSETQAPLEAIHLEHDLCRGHARAMEEAAQRALEGEIGQSAIIIEHAKGYAALLRTQMAKQDGTLSPLAERVLPAEFCDSMQAAFRQVASGIPRMGTKYLRMVEEYENQARNCI